MASLLASRQISKTVNLLSCGVSFDDADFTAPKLHCLIKSVATFTTQPPGAHRSRFTRLLKKKFPAIFASRNCFFVCLFSDISTPPKPKLDKFKLHWLPTKVFQSTRKRKPDRFTKDGQSILFHNVIVQRWRIKRRVLPSLIAIMKL